MAVCLGLTPHGALAAEATRYAVVAGGDHPFFSLWKQAALDAKADFGLAETTYEFPPDWLAATEAAMIRESGQAGFNAFGLFPDAPGGPLFPLIKSLAAQGVPVVALGGCLPDPSSVAFCLATDIGKSAYIGARELITAMGGKGTIVHLAGDTSDPNTAARLAAVSKAVAESLGAVTELAPVTDADRVGGTARIEAFLAEHRAELGGVIATGWNSSVSVARVLRRFGDKRILAVTIDHDKVVLDAIRDGFVFGTMLQNPYGQAYIGAWATDKLRRGCTVKPDAAWQTFGGTAHFVDSGSAFIGIDNVDRYAAIMRGMTKGLVRTFGAAYLSCS